MTRRTSPTHVEVTAATVMIAVAGLTVTAGVVAGPGPPGDSPWVLVWALVTAVVLLLAHRGLDPGWVAWRRATLGLVGVALAYPAVAATLALAVASDSTGGSWIRLLAALTTVGHVPVIAALSLLPLLAVRYVGDGLPPRPIAVVLALATVDVATPGDCGRHGAGGDR